MISIRSTALGRVPRCLRGLLPCWTLVVIAACTNAPPVLDPVPNQILEIGESLDITSTASDPNGDPLTYFGERLPPGAVLDGSSGRITWTPPGDRPRDCLISLGVRDTGTPRLTDEQNVMLSVVEPGARDDFGLLRATVRDADTGELLAARVSLRGSDGKPYGGRFEIPHDTFFYTTGSFSSDLPPGPAGITISVGTEYGPVEGIVEIPSRQTIEREFVLERWVHMADEGWFSG